MNFSVVIPARFASTRLPGKPLLDIGGKPMVVHVAERARASGATEVIVATDHPDIAAAVTKHGYSAVMTRSDHASGTDRIAEVAHERRYASDHIVVNVQGDEPLIEPDLIRCVAQQLVRFPDAAMSTACCALVDMQQFVNANIVKVVLDKTGTITEGSPKVIDIAWKEDADTAALSGVLYAMETRSEHPLATAVVSYLTGTGARPATISSASTI